MAGGKAFFEWKCNGSKNCEYNDAKCLSMCYFVFQAQKKNFLRFLLDRCRWRHRHPVVPPLIKYTSSCWEDQRLSIQGKILLKYCKNSTKGFNQPPPSPLILVPRGLNLRVRPGVKKYRLLTRWLTCLGYLNGDPIQK